MKMQIDTSEKTIKIEGDVKIIEFLTQIKKLFPEQEWREYTLQTNTIINNWNNPIYVDWYRPTTTWPWTPNPVLYTTGTTVTCNATNSLTATNTDYDTAISNSSGSTYNIQLQ